MPCIKCNNGKWKYGKNGRCVYKTLAACKAAAAAIHNTNKHCDTCTSIRSFLVGLANRLGLI